MGGVETSAQERLATKPLTDSPEDTIIVTKAVKKTII